MNSTISSAASCGNDVAAHALVATTCNGIGDAIAVMSAACPARPRDAGIEETVEAVHHAIAVRSRHAEYRWKAT